MKPCKICGASKPHKHTALETELWTKLQAYESGKSLRKLQEISLVYANLSVRLTKALRILDELKLLLTND